MNGKKSLSVKTQYCSWYTKEKYNTAVQMRVGFIPVGEICQFIVLQSDFSK